MKKLVIGGLIAIIVVVGIGVGGIVFKKNHDKVNSNKSSIQQVHLGISNDNSNNGEVSGNNTVKNTPNVQSINSNIQNNNNQNSNINHHGNISINNQTQNTSNSAKIINQNAFKMNLGNGNFGPLLDNNFIYITVNNGAKLIIDLSKNIENNQLQGTEYYINKLNETFNVKISAISGDKYLIYEFYNGKHTGTFEMNGTDVESGITGTYTHAGSDKSINANFYTESKSQMQFSNAMLYYPFYNGVVNGTPVTWISNNMGTYTEVYQGDNNLFNIDIDFSHTGNYQFEYLEEYNNQKIGEFYLSYNSNNNDYVGKYVKASNGQSESVTLKGSMKPNQ